ncbi:sulfotransferase [Lusitaniella coriacea LEGE 07157]|uniref:Sulfotransferase n=1 Tax=Lusitaniella coriacea LEGE 07157 TaxID=945747 RepID=A0A8J7JBW0_9CYAN|nr:sulfotransferase [Lusitaniella coriacea]MBE9117045.1 sulfotransferase [Lusitaniella coriacea LEGE 07157]
MKSPNFLIVGVQKAGTTSIYRYLKQHPQVYLSPVKETNFLEKDWEQRIADGNSENSTKINTFEQYCQLFSGVEDEIALGEASPNYLFHYKTAIERIKRYVPDAKLIAVLRNPTERAHSDHLMHIRDAIGSPKVKSLSEQVKFSAHKSFILRKGFYAQQLKHFYEQFDREKIRVYLYEDLCKDSISFMQEMYRFIGVDDTLKPDTSRRAQTAQVPKNQSINRMLRKQNPLRTAVASTLKVFLPEEKRQAIRQSLINLNSADKSHGALSQEERALLVDLYREDILELQELIDRDLSDWLKV